MFVSGLPWHYLHQRLQTHKFGADFILYRTLSPDLSFGCGTNLSFTAWPSHLFRIPKPEVALASLGSAKEMLIQPSSILMLGLVLEMYCCISLY